LDVWTVICLDVWMFGCMDVWGAKGGSLGVVAVWWLGGWWVFELRKG